MTMKLAALYRGAFDIQRVQFLPEDPKDMSIALSRMFADQNVQHDTIQIIPVPAASPDFPDDVKVVRTKGELAKMILDGFEYDCALPEQWLRGQTQTEVIRDRILSTHVWLYDGHEPINGRPFDLLNVHDKPKPLKLQHA